MRALAYLDAGSGSIILQAALGGFAALAVSLKLFWRRILTFLRIRQPEEDEPGAPMPAASPETSVSSEKLSEPTPR